MKMTLVRGAMLCVLLTSISEARASQAAAEQQCGIDTHRPAQRVFAKVDDQQPWREYKRVEEVPELALGFGIAAEAWKGNMQTLLIRTDEPGEDFEGYTEYCFNKTGQLIGLAYELRTVRDGASE